MVPPRRVGGSVAPGTDDRAGSTGTGRSSAGSANSGSGDGGAGVNAGGVHDCSRAVSPFAPLVGCVAAAASLVAAPSPAVAASATGVASSAVLDAIFPFAPSFPLFVAPPMSDGAADACSAGAGGGGGVAARKPSEPTRCTRFVCASSSTVGIAFSVGSPGSSTSSIGTSA